MDQCLGAPVANLTHVIATESVPLTKVAMSRSSRSLFLRCFAEATFFPFVRGDDVPCAVPRPPNRHMDVGRIRALGQRKHASRTQISSARLLALVVQGSLKNGSQRKKTDVPLKVKCRRV